jgi:hypothetical protein
MVDFENGTSEIECSVIKPKNLIEFRKNLVDPQLKQFNTIIIDTFDVVYSMISDEVLTRMNRQNKTNYQSIGEFGFGTGWKILFFYFMKNQKLLVEKENQIEQFIIYLYLGKQHHLLLEWYTL